MRLVTLTLAALLSPAAVSQDLPDPDFVDSDGDGIDGNAASAVFVAQDGSDAAAGTMAEPMLTIPAAIQRAVATARPAVYVSEGTYIGRVNLTTGIDLYGGFSRANQWARGPAYVSTIRSAAVSGGRVTALEAVGLGADVRVEGVRIETGSTSATGVSNYAVLVRSPGAGSLRIRYATIFAGNGGPGADANDGTTPAPAPDGTPGSPGACNDSVNAPGGPGGVLACGSDGGRGGNGGLPGALGASGEPAEAGTMPGPGGGAGNPGNVGASGATGSAGSAGADSAGGGAGPDAGIWTFPYTPTVAARAATGSPGSGGGGGGGGGGQDCAFCLQGTGNGGGGGGAGGCGGTGGFGGAGGAGSFGVYAPNGGVVVDAVRILSGHGGSGGDGGTGGSGGDGGDGAAGNAVCTTEVGGGGRGGDGGAGGRGGHGGSGSGGPSIGLVVPTADVVGPNVYVDFGTLSFPGASLGNLGAVGLVRAAAPATFTPASVPSVSIEPATAAEGDGATFVVRVAPISHAAVEVAFQAESVTASPADFTATSGQLRFDPWTSTRTIFVPVPEDSDVEGEETFRVVLSDADGAFIATAQAVGRIVDDDLADDMFRDGFE